MVETEDKPIGYELLFTPDVNTLTGESLLYFAEKFIDSYTEKQIDEKLLKRAKRENILNENLWIVMGYNDDFATDELTKKVNYASFLLSFYIDNNPQEDAPRPEVPVYKSFHVQKCVLGGDANQHIQELQQMTRRGKAQFIRYYDAYRFDDRLKKILLYQEQNPSVIQNRAYVGIARIEKPMGRIEQVMRFVTGR